MLRSSFAVTPGAVLSIPADSITGTQIGPSAVGNSELAADAVTSPKILDRTIQAVDVAAGTLTGNEIAVNSVPADRIQNLTVTPAMLQHPMGLQDQDFSGTSPGRLSGAKVDAPVRSIVQFNGAPMPAENYVNFIGTAGLLDVADEPAAQRVNVNLQGIITNAPAKGTDGQVLAVGGEPGNTVGSANAWSAANHGHQLKAVPIAGQYGNLATVPLASAAGAAADVTLSRTGPQQAALNSTLTLSPAGGQAAILAASGTAAAPAYGFTAEAGSGMFLGGPGQLEWSLAGVRKLFLSDTHAPVTDNTLSSGKASFRWSYVAAVNGTIQTSDPAQKLGAVPIDPADALADVLATTVLAYEMICPTEDDPEATMLHVGYAADTAPARLRVGRRVKGGVTTSAEVEPNSTASMALAAIQALHAQVGEQAAAIAELRSRVAALEGAAA